MRSKGLGQIEAPTNNSCTKVQDTVQEIAQEDQRSPTGTNKDEIESHTHVEVDKQ